MTATRIHLIIAALFGALGVAALAGGAHAAGPQMTLAGQMLLFHAPRADGGGAGAPGGPSAWDPAQIALALMATGIALFSADMGLRGMQGGAALCHGGTTWRHDGDCWLAGAGARRDQGGEAR